MIGRKIKKRKGFTLVELLVVISIMALLMAILMPVLGKARRQAKRVLCAANQHQWGLALQMYAGDNDNYFPYNGKPTPECPVGGSGLVWCSSTVQRFWAQYLVKADLSVKERKNNVLFCPTNRYERAWYDYARERFHDSEWALRGGLCGYEYLPHRGLWEPYCNFSPWSNPKGDGWVTKKKFGGKFSRAPILVCVMDFDIGPRSWISVRGMSFLQGLPTGCHANMRRGEPDGGNFLFEDGRVNWYNFHDLEPGAVISGYYSYCKPKDLF